MSASASADKTRSGFVASIQGWTNAHPNVFFCLLSAWYVVLVWVAARRPLWYDELFTFYIAQQPTVARLMAALHSIDLNPPLNYFLTRWSIALFGAKLWAARLPEMVAFWLGSLAVFFLLRRRTSALIAGIGVMLLWSTPYFSYATEARPYALLLGLTAVVVAAWDAAFQPERRIQLAIVGVGGVLLLLSHVFGLLSLGAVWAGEAVRSVRRRRFDAPMLTALAFPLLAIVTYPPLLHSAGAIVFPAEAAVTWGKLYYLYFSIFRWMWRPLVALLVAVLIVRGKSESGTLSRENPALWTALALLFSVPVVLTIVFLLSHGAFYERYGLVAVLPVVVIAPLLLARRIPRESTVALWSFLAVGILLLLSTSLRGVVQNTTAAMLPPKPAAKITALLITSPHGPFRPWFKNLAMLPRLSQEREHAPLISSLAAFHPELPIVAASELTFFEMDHTESDAVDHRLYYLYDRDAEIQIAHRSITDGVLNAQQSFPVRSKIEPYSTFLAEHRQFLVIGTYEHPGDWLLRKLQLDGVVMDIVARYPGYADSDVYLVSKPLE